MPHARPASPTDASSAWTPRAHLLSNGRFAALVSDAGGGYTMRGLLAVTRWNPDRTRDADGEWLYVRDLESGAVWSAGAQPVAGSGTAEARFAPGLAELRREVDGIELHTEVCVAPDADVALRRYTLVNRSDRPRRLALTTYAELVLNSPAADAGHPAFSKLFVQTAYHADVGTLAAWRRLRSAGDAPLHVAHAFVDLSGRAAFGGYETDRARFIGRGRSTAVPRALDAGAELSCSVGNVLDPVFAMRRIVQLAPGATAQLLGVLAAASDDSAVALAHRFANARAADDAFAGARERATRIADARGVSARWEEVPGLVGALLYAAPGHGSTPLEARVDDALLYALVAALPHSAPVPAPPMSPVATAVAAPPRSGEWALRGERLRHFNGYGGWTERGDEYVIRIEPGTQAPQLPPLPWTNVVANERVGFIVSERGAAYTWAANSRENRLTPWFNDPVTDPHGEALHLRDEESGAVWSPVPGPTPAAAPYEVRHGLGYSRWRHGSAALEQDVTMFVPRHDPVKIVRVAITNRGDRPRRLTLWSYAQLVLGVVPHESAPSVVTEYDAASGALLARNRSRGEFSHRVAFAALCAGDSTFTADRAAFLGARGSVAAPAAVHGGGPLDQRAGAALDPCAAFRAELTVAPGETAECVVLLGEGESADEAREVVHRYREPGAVQDALDEVRSFWRTLADGVQIATPEPALDLMVNHWLPYQNLACRMWGRSAFYQSGGAFGFRDQLQDAAALLYLDPSITRRQIVLHAGEQFLEGDVMHWWHPPLGKGIRTRFSDDLLWLPFVTSFYLRATGDSSVLAERAPLLQAALLDADEDELFLVPSDSGERASVYEHCCRAIDRSLTRGAHGLPLMGVGDWNDGMNRVGREGRGESVWLGFFLYDILTAFITICRDRGDDERVARYRDYRARLREALDAPDGGWDGGWYRRAYYDDGTPLGSAQSDECRIDVIAQAWSVLSGAAPPDRAAHALDAMERHLVSEREHIIRLLTPAFDRTVHDPGYIKGYLPGVRENGGQYTHGALWAVRALAEHGRSERAAPLLAMLSPVSHGSTAEQVATYQAEPYVIAADVYGVAPHVGRAGWTWYTGSAGWMYRVALESVLGFELDRGEAIVLRPCIPASWPGYSLRYRLPDGRTTYEIAVARAASGEDTSVSGAAASVAGGAVRIPLVPDGTTHRVEIRLAGDVGRRYEARRDD